MNRAPLLFLLLLAAAPAHADDSPLAWLNAMRGASPGAPPAPLVEDGLLSSVAGKWAAVLAKAGIISHRGADGSGALERYRALGGTDAHVGEIIGAGPSLAAVQTAWAASAEHADLARSRAWTHAGWGSAPYGTQQVWVVMLAEELVRDLRLEPTGGGVTVTGRFTDANAGAALLFVDMELIDPSSYEPATRSFMFVVPAPALPGYFRLGWERNDGSFRLTNAFTWPPGRGSPAGPDRFAAPAASP